NQTTPEDSPVTVSFTVGDVDNAATSLTLSAGSSDTSVLPVGNIVFGGTGANRTATLTPAANASGSSIVTISVSDGTLTTPVTFTLTVTGVNDAPTISTISDQTTPEDAPMTVSFTIGDVDTPLANLTLSASS